jgi:polyhydroxyalkanoate synthesis repressor PhaR
MPRRIKRYANRKLYDAEEGCYVSLADVAELVRGGERVRVVDNETGEDLTQQTLTQIILEEGKEGGGLIPADVLHDVLRQGQSAVGTGLEQLEHLGEEAGSLVQRSLGQVNRFLQGSDRPTAADVEELQHQIDRLEELLRQATGERKEEGARERGAERKRGRK